MKQLNRVAASLCVLGLVSGPVLAAVHKHPATLQKRVTKAQRVIDQNSSVSNVSNLNWENRIFLSGLVNVDGSWSNRYPMGGFQYHNHSSDINVNNANLMVDVKVNPWVAGHFNVAYLGDATNDSSAESLYYGHDHNQDKNGAAFGGSVVRMDEAYVNIGNFARTPLYMRVGKQYVGFGDYSRYAMVTPLTQQLSQTRATAVTAGLATNSGAYGQVYAFNGNTRENGKNDTNIRNYGFKLGYYGALHSVGLPKTSYNLDISMIRNLYDVDGLSGTDGSVTYARRVPGFAGHLDVNYQSFDFYANYVTALKSLLGYDSYYNQEGANQRAWAADLNGDYHFMLGHHKSRFGLSYQWAGQGHLQTATHGRYLFGGVHRRYIADFMTNVWHNTDLGLAFVHNVAFDEVSSNYASGSNVAVARLAVQF